MVLDITFQLALMGFQFHVIQPFKHPNFPFKGSQFTGYICFPFFFLYLSDATRFTNDLF